MRHWTLESIDWDRFDPAAVNPDVLKAIKASAMVEANGEDYFKSILEAYLATGRAICGTVGAARSELIDARDITAFAVDWMAERFR